MASKESLIKSILTVSSTWTTLVTGGTFLYDDLGRVGLDMTAAEANGCYDSSTHKLKLTAVLTFGQSTEAEVLGSESEFIRLWVYHDNAFATIRQAKRIAKNLFDKTITSKTTDEGTILIRWVDDMPDFTADELGGALAGCSRYRILFRRQ